MTRITTSTMNGLGTDAFVGGLAVVLGVVMVVLSWLNPPWLTAAPKFQYLTNSLGHVGGRVFLALLGFALIVLGLAFGAGVIGPRADVPFPQADGRERTGSLSSRVNSQILLFKATI